MAWHPLRGAGSQQKEHPPLATAKLYNSEKPVQRQVSTRSAQRLLPGSLPVEVVPLTTQPHLAATRSWIACTFWVLPKACAAARSEILRATAGLADQW